MPCFFIQVYGMKKLSINKASARIKKYKKPRKNINYGRLYCRTLPEEYHAAGNQLPFRKQKLYGETAMKKITIAYFLPLLLLGAGCAVSAEGVKERSGERQNGSATIRIVNWNAETFFDAHTDGSEYAEFKSSKSKWGKERYAARLGRLCDVMKKLNADVYVFEEIENEGIVYDIANMLAGGAWDAKKNWNYAAFAKAPGDALGCAVLSRYPIGDMTVHALDVRTHVKQPRMRPLISLSVFAASKRLVLCVNHWKSKLGGEKESEIWRDWQASVLAGLLIESGGTAFVACGDFNRDIGEFAKGAESGSVVLHKAGFGSVSENLVKSPWLSENARMMYSYYYDGAGERIDHFFIAGTAEVLSFIAETDGPWADEEGIPVRYVMHTGQGYSDHLPIAASIRY